VPEPRLLRVRAFGPRWEGTFEELADRLREA